MSDRDIVERLTLKSELIECPYNFGGHPDDPNAHQDHVCPNTVEMANAAAEILSLRAELAAARETNPRPMNGWTCFHCGETFLLDGLAEDHFGTRQCAEPGCQIKKGHERNMLHKIRELETEIWAYRSETDEESRKHYARQAEYAQALIREEEKGYNKGVADMRTELAAARDAAIEECAVELERHDFTHSLLPTIIRGMKGKP